MTTTQTKSETVAVTLPASELGTLLKSGLASVGTDPARPILNVVRLEITAQKVRTVSTDSYTLLIQELSIGKGSEVVGSGTFSIPVASVKEWTKVLASRDLKDAPATLTHVPGAHEGEGKTTLTVPGATFTTQEPYGRYPAYESLAPAESDYKHEFAAFNPHFLARMSGVVVPGYDKKAMESVAWRCQSMTTTRCAVWACEAPPANYSATFLQMPVRVS